MADEKPKKRRGPGRPFLPGDDPRRANVPGPKEPPARVEVEGAGLLGDMRFVWENDKAHDDTPQRKRLRKLLDADLHKFYREFRDLEKADLLGKGGGDDRKGGTGESGSATAPAAPDLGTARCLELIDDLLKDT